MKIKVFTILILAVSLMLSLPWTIAAQESEPITLHIDIAVEPRTLDPAWATDMTSTSVVEQLFIGLVDLDDVTGEVKPELATSWDVSPDGTVFTFTLRNDVLWTDGSQVTANDVRYGILRTLNPTTASGYAYILFPIKNAEAYHKGQITDPSQVGVTVLDDTHLRITLEYPAVLFSLFSL
jgi:oligopeptide transport system substrate-binding protein